MGQRAFDSGRIRRISWNRAMAVFRTGLIRSGGNSPST